MEIGYRKDRLSMFVPEADLPFCIQDSKPVALATGSKTPTPRTFDQNGDPDLSGVLTFFVAGNSNARIAAQSGLFSVYIGRDADEVVADHAAYMRQVEASKHINFLTKVIIPAAVKPNLQDALSREGVDARSIFPDLQGLGIHLNTWQRKLLEDTK
jgi:hypothetical protein